VRKLLVIALVIAAGCRKTPTREWRADDHDQEQTSPFQVSGVAPSAAASAGEEALAETTWRTTCAICHGALGKGDGPNGPMVKAPDLTALQAQRTDDQLAAVIKTGRGKMPAFPQLPPKVVDGLVKRIRAAAAMPPQP
jgi:mono/diheme cytochrome c family protein